MQCSPVRPPASLLRPRESKVAVETHLEHRETSPHIDIQRDQHRGSNGALVLLPRARETASWLHPLRFHLAAYPRA